jgi:hypothetical protein
MLDTGYREAKRKSTELFLQPHGSTVCQLECFVCRGKSSATDPYQPHGSIACGLPRHKRSPSKLDVNETRSAEKHPPSQSDLSRSHHTAAVPGQSLSSLTGPGTITLLPSRTGPGTITLLPHRSRDSGAPLTYKTRCRCNHTRTARLHSEKPNAIAPHTATNTTLG